MLGPNGKVKKRIQEDKEKIVVLINDALSGDPSNLLDFTLTQVRDIFAFFQVSLTSLALNFDHNSFGHNLFLNFFMNFILLS